MPSEVAPWKLIGFSLVGLHLLVDVLVAAVEFGSRGIRSNIVHPGYVDDQLLDEMGRVLDSMYAHFATSTKSSNTGGRS